MKNATLLLVVGLFIGSSAVAVAGQSEFGERECARRLCADLRNCGDGEQEGVADNSSKPKDFVSKKSKNSEDAQGRRAGSCREWAWLEYMYCSFEGSEIRVKETPVEKKSVNITPTND